MERLLDVSIDDIWQSLVNEPRIETFPIEPACGSNLHSSWERAVTHHYSKEAAGTLGHEPGERPDPLGQSSRAKDRKGDT